ncbi:hypothetical protein [Flammeovirga kamogawensis]|uniref:Helix-turn-helix domain-containing protein n=1 Tax=Flammeovirga kamogawensis TaxID=373891 RepID=A0ABX8GSY4_9BACT|nr:hypothetical protein [Flammeovirga kamogawensis]MBB6463338.1 putative transcriptional regulator [Flammeovirga kamogawensis]QWG06690.1 hypothetical protein KM029_15440 [Flammeovirga kamogawensis]TRX68512.1 hypothetical protein EO216_10435 [Flammeovirga kamogawensis]
METQLQKQIIALHAEGMSYRKIGAEVGLSHAKVGEIIRSVNTQQENELLEGTEEVENTLLQDEYRSISSKKKLKKKSKKEKTSKAMKKQIAKMQDELSRYKKKLENSQLEAYQLNGTIELRDQEMRLKEELSEHFEEVLELNNKPLEHEELLHSFNTLWEWNNEVSVSPLLYKTFKEEYKLVSKLSDSFEKGLRKFDENEHLEEVHFHFSTAVISQIKSHI